MNQPGTPLDAVALARLRELDPDGRHGVLTRVLTVFQTSLSRMLVQLADEREGGDAGVVAMLAHTLKSSSGSVGAMALNRACHEVEQALLAGSTADNAADLPAHVDRLCVECEAALLAVEAMLQP